MQNYFDELLMNLEFKMEILLCDSVVSNGFFPSFKATYMYMYEKVKCPRAPSTKSMFTLCLNSYYFEFL